MDFLLIIQVICKKNCFFIIIVGYHKAMLFVVVSLNFLRLKILSMIFFRCSTMFLFSSVVVFSMILRALDVS